jgi:shikimate kinase
MATGKTTLGRAIAEGLGRPFVDSDEQLEHDTGLTAAQIAERDGRDALHAREADLLLAALADPQPSVIAAAASTIEDERCRRALADAFLIWLRVDPDVLARRVREKGHRPLAGDVAAQLREQAARRDPLFVEVADFIVS